MNSMKNHILLIPVIMLFLVSVVSASTTFSNNFESLNEISADGGVIQGSATIVDGAFGNGVYLPGTSAIKFPKMDFADQGMISFWVKPDYDVRSFARYETASFLEVGDFPGSDSMAVWVYKSEYGPFLPFEMKDSYARIKQVWSKKNRLNPDKWHQIILAWSVNNPKGKKNYIRIYVDGKGSKRFKGGLRDVYLDNKSIRIGNAGFYYGESATFDKLEVYSGFSEFKVLKKQYKTWYKAWKKANK